MLSLSTIEACEREREEMKSYLRETIQRCYDDIQDQVINLVEVARDREMLKTIEFKERTMRRCCTCTYFSDIFESTLEIGPYLLWLRLRYSIG